MSIHGDDELDEIDKEIKGLSEGAAENSKKTPQKGLTVTMNINFVVLLHDLGYCRSSAVPSGKCFL